MSCFQLSGWEKMSDWNEYRKECKRVFWRKEISTTPQKFCYQEQKNAKEWCRVKIDYFLKQRENVAYLYSDLHDPIEREINDVKEN